MNTVVKQECLRYNKLLWAMTSSLKDFRKAIKGEVLQRQRKQQSGRRPSGGYQRPEMLAIPVAGLIVMTAELEAAGKSLFVNEVPEMPRSYTFDHAA